MRHAKTDMYSLHTFTSAHLYILPSIHLPYVSFLPPLPPSATTATAPAPSTAASAPAPTTAASAPAPSTAASAPAPSTTAAASAPAPPLVVKPPAPSTTPPRVFAPDPLPYIRLVVAVAPLVPSSPALAIAIARRELLLHLTSREPLGLVDALE